ncbi:hypothetical protein Q5H91_04260 [Sphingomonas sp. KR1UV-12]|uniref:Uncharacterized protein n=1 Tax=Sphingomonas aurea TaxID=3063994 RepID=A0ABT9EI10_9SPHN|nr:hypothetical protein [Sphingomonas sp. KR1UV-12]MDP1026416.1 hypothetical protein [Sphingomonas sp. KR1UV-12]
MIQYPTDPDLIRALSDEQLLEAYERTTGAACDAEADALLEEIRRRELDV